ncbi:EPIDERMAL PATTERNING FACTOR-like protein 3 [Gossypium arboreum]|uniref:Epidermal patterning factor-like protein n=1 Tax=Gossypium arboreum TaxID=29729 RepID=A0ABR0NE58_GOSAR|nr:EPIDERMAL PATTERNING FACTOR-like protein 3 [Gossypium arboreum]KAK5792526.1 hypothetical protein PVK06_033641 [Gossypium arboreum]
MEASLFWFLLALQIVVTWSCATSRSLTPDYGFGANQPGQNPESLQVPLGPSSSSKEVSSQSYKSKQGKGNINGETYVEAEIGRLGIGSGRPSCEHKCYGCSPCEAIQVPTTPGKHSHVSLQSANYEPESWKCKCGPTFYSP